MFGSRGPLSDGVGMGGDQQPPAACDPVLAVFPVALPRVYGYLLPRCRGAAVARLVGRQGAALAFGDAYRVTLGVAPAALVAASFLPGRGVRVGRVAVAGG